MASEQEKQIRRLIKYRNREFKVEAGLILQNVHFTLSLNFDLRFLNIPRNIFSIEQIINGELMAYRSMYMAEEDFFVGQMLIQEPVTFGRRSREITRKDMNPVQMMKAESCRRSRFNGKIKKALVKHRHSFITLKLKSSAELLRYVHGMIGLAEFKLVQGGCDPNRLLQMRAAFGLNHNIDHLLAIPDKLK